MAINDRIVVQNAQKYLGQSIMVVNTPNDGDMLGKIEVIQSKPDGMTLGLMATSFVSVLYL